MGKNHRIRPAQFGVMPKRSPQAYWSAEPAKIGLHLDETIEERCVNGWFPLPQVSDPINLHQKQKGYKMAYKNKDMSVIAYANGWTMWHYKNYDDTIEDIINDTKYFGKIFTLINQGDVIVVNAKDKTKQLVVLSVEENTVVTEVM